jgi:hypothetical protein
MKASSMGLCQGVGLVKAGSRVASVGIAKTTR